MMAQNIGSGYQLFIEKAVARAQGSREHQEDRFALYDDLLKDQGFGVYCVFDGHGTEHHSTHASKNMIEILMNEPDFKSRNFDRALRRAFYDENEALRKQFEQGVEGGTTATVALIADGTLYMANVGDSRAVMGVREKHHVRSDVIKAVRLSHDHSFDDESEKRRIIESGGDVRGGRVRHNGHGINMTRALGDFDFKQPYNHAQSDFISAEPFLQAMPVSPNEEFIVLASDGLWGAISDQNLVELVAKRREMGESAEKIVASIVSSISHVPGSDNITIMILLFDWKPSTNLEIASEGASLVKKVTQDQVEVYTPSK